MEKDKSQVTLEEPKAKKVINPVVIIASVVVFAAILTYIVPAGAFDRVMNEDIGREVISDINSYHRIDGNPQNIFEFFTLLSRGMQDAAYCIFFLFIIGAAFRIVEVTGALQQGLKGLVKILKGKEIILIPICIFTFGIISATAACWEEYLAVMPLIYIVCVAAGFNSITAVACIFCGAATGYAGGMANPFTVGVAQTIAGIPLFSGVGYRIVVFVVIGIVSSAFIIWYSLRIKRHPEKNDMAETDKYWIAQMGQDMTDDGTVMTGRQKGVLIVFGLSFVAVIFGVLKFGWAMDQMSGVFLVASILMGIIYKMNVNVFIDEFLEGCKNMVWIGVLIGLCYTISGILNNAGVMDTIIYWAGSGLQGVSATVCAPAMYFVQDLLNVLIPSGSGQAAVTMPFMAPLADIVGVSRQTAVLAFQMGDSFTNVIAPTSPEIIAAIAMCHVPYKKWLKFIIPLWVLWSIAATILLVVAVHIGF